MNPESALRELRELAGQGQRMKYVFFWGHRPRKDGSVNKSCFSQWFEASFTLDGQRYPTAEHYMMAEKARLFDDQATLKLILEASTPAQAKQLGRQIQGFDAQQWDARRFEAVVEGNAAKFGQNPQLAEFLLSTGDQVLVEASPVDPIWGSGMAEDHADVEDPRKWQGLNLLGFALMAVRSQIRSKPSAQIKP